MSGFPSRTDFSRVGFSPGFKGGVMFCAIARCSKSVSARANAATANMDLSFEFVGLPFRFLLLLYSKRDVFHTVHNLKNGVIIFPSMPTRASLMRDHSRVRPLSQGQDSRGDAQWPIFQPRFSSASKQHAPRTNSGTVRKK